MSNLVNQTDTILIVDDIPENVKILYSFLNDAGFKVLVATEGKRAIQTAEHVQPDLILLDVMMPEMDGFEVCHILKSKDNTRAIPIIFLTALTDTVDKVKGFSLGAVDYITKPLHYEEVLARVNTHLSLRHLQQELLQRNLELDAFARTVAHDLKNPLSAIVGLADLVVFHCDKDQLLNDQMMGYLRSISQAGQTATNIINALLTLAGVSTHRDVEKQVLDMATIVNNASERLEFMLKDYQGELILPEQWLSAVGYAPWIEEVWVNYISNGFKYGGKPPCLELGCMAENEEMVRFWVKDNGQGLSEEAQTKLFTPFTRLHKKQAEGHGLGLSIVQQITEKLGGEVGVDSELGAGSTFYFTLPALKT